MNTVSALSAGPVDAGKIPNMYKCIVCDPDEKSFESSALGLLYTAVSRGTTLGDSDGMNSAVYFTGSSFKEQEHTIMLAIIRMTYL